MQPQTIDKPGIYKIAGRDLHVAPEQVPFDTTPVLHNLQAHPGYVYISRRTSADLGANWQRNTHIGVCGYRNKRWYWFREANTDG